MPGEEDVFVSKDMHLLILCDGSKSPNQFRASKLINPQRCTGLAFCKNWWPDRLRGDLDVVAFKGSGVRDADHLVLVPSKYSHTFKKFVGVELDGKAVLFDEWVAREGGDIERCCELVREAGL